MQKVRFHFHPKWWVWLIVVLFAWFVWPTQWKIVGEPTGIVRIHRITGEAQLLDRDGWRGAAR